MASTTEDFGYLYSVSSYNTATGALVLTNTTNTLNHRWETITYSSATIPGASSPPKTGTAGTANDGNGRRSGGETGTYTYIGAVKNSAGAYIGILVSIGGHDYFMAQSAVTSTTGLTVNTADGWTLSTTADGGSVSCFMARTMIATPEGDVAVETLKAGDMVTLANGGIAPVIWLGRQTVATRFADPLRVQPIRIRAGALADGVPARDLLLSPDHAVLVDGVLIQAAALVNGVGVVREAEMPEMFTYYHVEVADHALILAENTPAETFIDNADRLGFDNWDEHPGDVQLVEMDLPRAKSARQVPAGTHARLAARSAELYGLLDDAAAA